MEHEKLAVESASKNGSTNSSTQPQSHRAPTGNELGNHEGDAPPRTAPSAGKKAARWGTKRRKSGPGESDNESRPVHLREDRGPRQANASSWRNLERASDDAHGRAYHAVDTLMESTTVETSRTAGDHVEKHVQHTQQEDEERRQRANGVDFDGNTCIRTSSSSSSSYLQRAQAASHLPAGTKPPPDAHYGFMGMGSGRSRCRGGPTDPAYASGSHSHNQALEEPHPECERDPLVRPPEGDACGPLNDFELRRKTAAERRKRFVDQEDKKNGPAQLHLADPRTGRTCGEDEKEQRRQETRRPNQDNYFNAYSDPKFLG